MSSVPSHFPCGASVPNPYQVTTAFSAFDILRNCNYLLSPCGPDAPKHEASHTCEYRIPCSILEDYPHFPVRDHEKSFLGLPRNPLTGFMQFAQPHDRNILSTYTDIAAQHHIKRQRGEKKPIPEEQKDEKYFERRKRNNQAAKKSRDARKLREDQIALKATILEHENTLLKAQILTLREEASSLRQLLLQKKSIESTNRNSQT